MTPAEIIEGLRAEADMTAVRKAVAIRDRTSFRNSALQDVLKEALEVMESSSSPRTVRFLVRLKARAAAARPSFHFSPKR